MAYYVYDAKPLFDPRMTFCQLDFWEQSSLKFVSKYIDFL